MKWEPKTADYERSPYTGLTRESWLEAAEYMLKGIFLHIRHFEDPVVVPRQETEITYPHLQDPPQAQRSQRSAEIFEGLTRSFFIAAPLVANRPDVSVGGYSLAEYYRYQVLRSCTKLRPVYNAAGEDESYVGTYEELQAINHTENPYSCYQQTVETCALVICLWVSRRQIWDNYTKEERDAIAGFLTSYAHHATVPQNWRLFNMLDMAFLHMEGYPIDEAVMREHAQAVLNYYAGDGWYRDGHSFDYYSCWAFNMYAPLWNLWYGYENMPWVAAQFEAHSNELMRTYGDFFDRDGWTNMWGRSNVYRFAAVSAFDGNLLMPGGQADPGRARRIASGSLLQFLSREDFLQNGIPTLGFYGQFSPLVQGYSCAESPFWLGKAFLCLHLPPEHPFWTARENNGTWETLEEGQVKETCLDGPALCFSNHGGNGETILRTGKVVKNCGDIHGMWNYSKLCYNTKYPWEASLQSDSGTASGQKAEQAVEAALEQKTEQVTEAAPEQKTEQTRKPAVSRSQGFISERLLDRVSDQALEAQQYVLQTGEQGEYSRANVTFWHGQRDRVLYRRQFFDYNLENECHWIQAMNLADFAVPCGIVRVDKLRLYRTPVRLTLGAYGFPDNGTEILEKEAQYRVLTGTGSKCTDAGKLPEADAAGADAASDDAMGQARSGILRTARAVILKGHDSTGREKQLAMTIYDGWESLGIKQSEGTNPDSLRSLIVYGVTSRGRLYGNEPYILISQVITKEGLEDFTEEELFPIVRTEYADPEGCGGYGPVELLLQDGSRRRICFEGIEGRMML